MPSPALQACLAWCRRRALAFSRRPGLALFLGAGLASGILGVLIASPRTLRPSYHYVVGDFAVTTVRAPWDLSVLDEEATARLRDDTARHTPPVASVDVHPTTVRPAWIAAAFAAARQLIAIADATRDVPAAELAQLGPAARRRLQAARGREADRSVQAAVHNALGHVESQLGVLLTPEERTALGAGKFDQRFDDGLRALLREAYSRPVARDVQVIRDAATHSQRPGEPPRVVLRAGPPAADRLLPDAAAVDDVPGAVARMRARAALLHFSGRPRPRGIPWTPRASVIPGPGPGRGRRRY